MFTLTITTFCLAVLFLILYKLKIKENLCLNLCTILLVLTILFSACGIFTMYRCKATAEWLDNKKEFIDNNMDSTDLYTQLEVQDAYYQYMFKLDSIEKSKSNMFSVYRNFNISKYKE